MNQEDAIEPTMNLPSLHVAIYGVGSAGRQLARALKDSKEYTPVIFLDDARGHGHMEAGRGQIEGLPVLLPKYLSELIQKYNLRGVLLAMPSLSRSRRSEILRFLSDFPLFVRTLPDLSNYAECLVRPNDIREIHLEDLLGRDPVSPKTELLRANVTGKVVLVSGAGGSIGSELCQQILGLSPRSLILLDHAEYLLYKVERKLQGTLPQGTLLFSELASIANFRQMQFVFKKYQVDTVYHAAAYKHVPLVEKNPLSAIENNVFGSLHLAEASVESGVANFILVSSDKAVRPTSVMGASKRMSELILQAWSADAALCRKTCFAMVRFGNVLDSSGSVVPLFREQIARGGPIRLTDERMFRYFMTIPEAASLVLQAGALAQGGEVFVLDMGEPVRILDLARRMIHLHGLCVRDKDNPDGDIEIQFFGKREGEKFAEELLLAGEFSSTLHPKIFQAKESFLEWADLKKKLWQLKRSISRHDFVAARQVLVDCAGLVV